MSKITTRGTVRWIRKAQAAVMYELRPSVGVVKRKADGSVVPETLSVSAFRIEGDRRDEFDVERNFGQIYLMVNNDRGLSTDVDAGWELDLTQMSEEVEMLTYLLWLPPGKEYARVDVPVVVDGRDAVLTDDMRNALKAEIAQDMELQFESRFKPVNDDIASLQKAVDSLQKTIELTAMIEADEILARSIHVDEDSFVRPYVAYDWNTDSLVFSQSLNGGWYSNCNVGSEYGSGPINSLDPVRGWKPYKNKLYRCCGVIYTWQEGEGMVEVK